MANYVLFLDDERTPPKPENLYGWEVKHAKNLAEFSEIIQTFGEPAMVQFDWYLGCNEPDGMKVAQWLIDYDREHDIITEDMLYDSHSSDIEKAREIFRLMNTYMASKFDGSK